MLKPICVSCQREMSMEKSGVDIIEHMADGSPYRITAGNMYRCSGCGRKVVTDFVSDGVEHYEEQFAGRLALSRSLLGSKAVELKDFKENHG